MSIHFQPPPPEPEESWFAAFIAGLCIMVFIASAFFLVSQIGAACIAAHVCPSLGP